MFDRITPLWKMVSPICNVKMLESANEVTFLDAIPLSVSWSVSQSVIDSFRFGVSYWISVLCELVFFLQTQHLVKRGYGYACFQVVTSWLHDGYVLMFTVLSLIICENTITQ